MVGTGSAKNGINDKNGKIITEHLGLGYRHQQCLILFLSALIFYIIRSCMSVALVAMTAKPEFRYSLQISQEIGRNNVTNGTFDGIGKIGEITEEFKPNDVLDILMMKPPYPTFKWPKKIQDTILSSFFWGYMLLQIPSAMLAQRFGSRYMLSGAMLLNSLIFISLPWAAYYGGWMCTFLCRFVQGLSQACLFPSIHTFCGRWAPLQERSRLTALIYGGQPLGVVLGLPITGFIASSGMGWPGIFRFYGIIGCFFTVVMWWYLADTPAQHPKISHAERKYIEQELGSSQKSLRVPWGAMLRCTGVWAIVIAHIGQAWGQLIMYTQVPSYMANVMGVNIRANGILTALPFLFMWMMNFLYSYLCDLFINKKIFSVTNTRKLANSFGSVLAACFFVILCYVPKNIYIVETVLILVCSTKMAGQLGFQIINIDMSPNFAGPIMSISQVVANGIGSFSPVISGFILTDATNPYLWRYVFLITAGLYFFSNLFFVIFASAKKVEWNEAPEDTSIKCNLEENVPMMKVLLEKT